METTRPFDFKSLPQLPDISFNAVIAALEAMLFNKVLVDALRREPLQKKRTDGFDIRLDDVTVGYWTGR